MPESNIAELFEPLRVALGKASEPERYRLLAAFFGEFAEDPQLQGRGPVQEQAEALGKKVARLSEERARLEDDLAATKADLELRTKQLDAELQRSKELERIGGEQRTRLQQAQAQVAELGDQVVAKNAQLHEAQSEVERLTVKMQRAERVAGDTSRTEALEESRRKVEVELEQARRALEQLRTDKDAEIERVKAELRTAAGAAGTGGEAVLAGLWARLVKAKPPLANFNAAPPVQAAERLVDVTIELARFVHEFDQSVSPYMARFTKYNPAVERPWDVYARSGGLDQLVREVLDPQQAKPAGVVKMRLLGLKRWAMAAIAASDIALDSIAHELEEQMRNDAAVGFASDPNRKTKDYVKEDGHERFRQHIRELHGKRLAEVYAKGV